MAPIRARGCGNFRQRLVAATLVGRPLRIDGIREDDEEPGLRDFEASFLRLLEKLCDGCRVEINETGTKLRYVPGLVTGGKVTHSCEGRAAGYFLEGIIPLALFAKRPLLLSLSGITNDDVDLGIDTLRTVTLPLLERFGAAGATLTVKRRGAPPKGGGLVVVSLPIVKELQPVDLTNVGLVKRIRGVAYTAKVSPQIANRLVDSARALLNRFLPDVWIYTDHYSGARSGGSPGFAVSIVAETTEGCMISSEAAAEGGTLPEDLGVETAAAVLDQVQAGGFIDEAHHSLCIMLMALTTEDVSRLRVGGLSEPAIRTLQLLRDVFGSVFRIRHDQDGSVLLSCLGNGFRNVAKSIA
uniref:RNA 3'-terminal-phosphate cyclase (ATP) n=1 Tax=Pinguiococcus pyrenoidosus TaxID=172671 RepID=A0A7R9U6Q7_9STRA|mmetsp:Transcript_17150/g.65458  ORF Transcript_17150/g.65458 Transcript_17150/m.65458 type:complete len:355 (+) Transcript_17150:35-1099(+)|eukprot:scaffold3504_cov240-Pinguiococcus_pyrenoidosus.AAC.22